jgi:hypothetical protein
MLSIPFEIAAWSSFLFEILLAYFYQNTSLLAVIIYFFDFFNKKKMNLGNNPEMSYDTTYLNYNPMFHACTKHV